MPTSEPLVPNDLPQGERQKVVEGMKRAGLPLAPPAGGRPVVGATPIRPQQLAPVADEPLSGPALLAETSPGDFPFLSQPQPTPPADAPRSPIEALAASAQSDFGRAVLARLQARGR